MEEDAVERMRNDFNEIYDDDTNRLASVEVSTVKHTKNQLFNFIFFVQSIFNCVSCQLFDNKELSITV